MQDQTIFKEKDEREVEREVADNRDRRKYFYFSEDVSKLLRERERHQVLKDMTVGKQCREEGRKLWFPPPSFPPGSFHKLSHLFL